LFLTLHKGKRLSITKKYLLFAVFWGFGKHLKGDLFRVCDLPG